MVLGLRPAGGPAGVVPLRPRNREVAAPVKRAKVFTDSAGTVPEVLEALPGRIREFSRYYAYVRLAVPYEEGARW